MKKILFLVPITLITVKALFGQQAAYSINVANDIFNLLNQSDRYFTSGIELKGYHTKFGQSPVNFLLIKAEKSNPRLSGIFLMQNIFTPSNIYATDVLIGDRPYASYLLLGQELVSVNSDHSYRITSSIGIGLIGKFSGGQTFQNFIHGLTPHSENANGWSHQIHHDFVLDYKVCAEKGLINLPWFRVNAIGKIQAGTLADRLDIGLAVHSGTVANYFGTPLFSGVNKSHSVRFFGDVSLAYVFYDATLQGGVINAAKGYRINTDDITNNRINYRFGVQADLKSFTLEVGRVWETREFIQAKDHAWGYIKVQLTIL